MTNSDDQRPILEHKIYDMMDPPGRVVREGKVATELAALVAWLRQQSVDELA